MVDFLCWGYPGDGKVKKGTDSYAEDLAKLQQANPRKMIMRVLKNRMGAAGKSCYLNFDAHGGFFIRELKTEEDIFGGKRKADMVR